MVLENYKLGIVCPVQRELGSTDLRCACAGQMMPNEQSCSSHDLAALSIAPTDVAPSPQLPT